MIKSSGPTSSKIFFITDYPSTAEKKDNVALTGYTSNQLDQLLREHGTSMDQSYRSIILRDPEHPAMEDLRSRNKTRRNGAYRKILSNFNYEILANEINAVHPKVIVPLGELALRAITGEKGVYEFRGSLLAPYEPLRVLLKHDNIHVVPMVHPRDYFADNQQRFISAFDLGKIVKYSNIPYFNPLDKYKVWVCRSVADLRAFIRRWESAEFWTFDIETHNGFITCISLCGGPQEAISVPFLDPRVPDTERGLLYYEMQCFLANNKPKVNQNIKFDWVFLEAWGFEVNNVMDDTMILAHSIYSELPKSLGFINSIHTDIPYYKDEGKEFDPKKHTKDQLYLYNAKDALSVWISYKSLRSDAKEIGVWDFHQRGPQKWLPIYKKIDQHGFLIDDETRRKKIERYDNILEFTLQQLEELTGQPKFNPNSSQQCKKLLYDDLGCHPMTKKDAEGRTVLTTDEDSLEELILNYCEGAAAEITAIIQGIVKARKIYRILNFLHTPFDLDMRIRQSTKQVGTENGRTSASKSIFERNILWNRGKLKRVHTGYSFQTIPKHGFRLPTGEVLGDDLIEIFVPAKGHVFLSGDLSQAEARVVAVLAKDWDLLTGFDTRDVHKETASWIYNCKMEDIKKPSFERDLGKMTRHAGNLDMQPPTLALRAHIALKFAREVMTRFHSKAPNVQKVFHASIRDEVYKCRKLVSPHGRQRFFFDKFDDDLFRQAYSFIPQSTITDHMKFTMYQISEGMKAKNREAHFIYENHDGIMAEQRIEDAELFMDLFVKYAETPISFRDCSIPRDCEIVIPVERDFSKERWNHHMTDWSKWNG